MRSACPIRYRMEAQKTGTHTEFLSTHPSTLTALNDAQMNPTFVEVLTFLNPDFISFDIRFESYLCNSYLLMMQKPVEVLKEYIRFPSVSTGHGRWCA